VLNGDLEPVWSPTTVANAVTNGDNSPNASDASTTTTMPITWETDWDDVVHDLRGNEELYTYFLANFGGRVIGVQNWNFSVMSGAKPPSEVMSVSMEALLLLFFLNYAKVWESQQSSEDSPSADSGSMSSVSMASVTLYTKQNNSSTKDGWSVEGIRKFQDLKVKVKEDRDSDHGKEFDGRFQRLMKARQLSADQASRKRKRVSATEQLSSITNKLSDASSSEDES